MLKHVIACMLLCFCTLGVHAKVVNVDSAELFFLAASGVAVIDIRTAPEWRETGVIPGSKLLTFFDEKGRFDAKVWLKQLKSLTNLGQPVALISRSGNRSYMAAQFLNQQTGYETVYNAQGGMKAWSQEGRPVVPSNSPMATCTAGALC